jgi:valine--pyruvate aminotransferase
MHSSNQPAPHFEFSLTGRRLSARSGIGELMEDLGHAMTVEPHMRMLGGGNPAAIPQLQQLLQQRMRELLKEGETFNRMLGNYEPPQGNPKFRRAMAELLQREFGWNIGPNNIAVTSGGQTAYFFLFNLLGGIGKRGHRRKILLPLTPEYIGYADQGIEPDLFIACRPEIDWPDGPGAREFKYRIDFPAVEKALSRGNIGAIAASRPTNPTGNVLTDAEVRRLSDLAAEHRIPLILDNAYGAPFPAILFVPAQPFWAPHVVLTFSLSKLGLPGTRTGIVVAPEQIASAIGALTAMTGLANSSIGQQLVLPWIETGKILELGPGILQPFYARKRMAASLWIRESFTRAGIDWAVHRGEGAFFHWLWLRGLRLTTRELYERLKRRKVLTVPGEYFFFGQRKNWSHRNECLRLNFAQAAETVREAVEIIAQEAAKFQH